MLRVDALSFAPSTAPELGSKILLWARPFMEGCLWTNRRFRFVGDQDEALLYLAAWQFVMGDIAANRALLDDIGSLPAADALERLSPGRFRASSLASLVEETGIPRETARRKLAALVRRGLFVAHDDSTFRLARLSADILDLARPAFGLARWMLVFHGRPAEALGDPRSLRSVGSLIRLYLSAYIILAKERRIHTGGTSQVSIQMSLMLMHVLKAEKILSIEGPPARWDFPTFVSLALRLMDEPYDLREVSRLADLPMSAVRSGCRRLAEVNGLVTLIDGETLRVGGRELSVRNISERRFYSPGVERRLTVFAARVLERGVRASIHRGTVYPEGIAPGR